MLWILISVETDESNAFFFLLWEKPHQNIVSFISHDIRIKSIASFFFLLHFHENIVLDHGCELLVKSNNSLESQMNASANEKQRKKNHFFYDRKFPHEHIHFTLFLFSFNSLLYNQTSNWHFGIWKWKKKWCVFLTTYNNK